ncbi:MgtC/SapB family protein [Legionella waltersii]|uniref:Protein MgtC n=1 Tax=Legionella waltersii TaxID=66969 RepID=A0A0W1AMC9_9GAMM|nr:MgtC/SapB family protein [Legionella waltersii]KTD82506.1 putative Mg(2+) transport ATPase [Legionella waltersii]SNV02948.1 putative Mg(2+) transport ATPase [Legionella waltersii]
MVFLSLEHLLGYWTSANLEANIIIFLNLLGSLCLGMIVGYERYFHGHAAGMRTYGLVCMASTAVVVIAGYPSYWFGSNQGGISAAPDITRVIQGIVTGIGFLGAGVIMREEFSIRGLTTSASIWAASAIGILVGVGFYVSAISLTFLSVTLMIFGYKIEKWLPSRNGIAVSVTFNKEVKPNLETIAQVMKECDYMIASASISITTTTAHQEWHFVAIPLKRKIKYTIPDVSKSLSKLEGLAGNYIGFARN